MVRSKGLHAGPQANNMPEFMEDHVYSALFAGLFQIETAINKYHAGHSRTEGRVPGNGQELPDLTCYQKHVGISAWLPRTCNGAHQSADVQKTGRVGPR